ncbi:two-component sensor histidine kinase [Pseudoxanthomonas kalamensis DSM 18571]|uniref:sensor histidine kinase n=1 Tax=Pseudoxanthomonas kalamensis TaxID=289483 RepID=UPI0013910D7C|nr:sensor histidine kinase [Pseudoxanthomonas kalamensis]KAF1709368.1 two-component sensor histidine kinase [Pseudoxanthomonas kalamensis DSM 18571]
MWSRLSHTRLLRAAGLYTWALVGIPIIGNAWFLPPSSGVDEDGINVPMAVVSYLVFGLSYWLATRSLGAPRVVRTAPADIILLLLLTAAAVAVGLFTKTGLGALLMLIVAGVLPWLLSLRNAVVWLVLAHVFLVPSFMALGIFNFWEAVFQASFYVGFAVFVLVTTYVARQQAAAREEQRRLNAELRATRVLLAESARANERTRISRELHDLLGHHLTALSLNLEVASHITEGRAQEHVRQAHTLARLLLTDVREAVSQLREDGAMSLAAALLPLAEGVPGLDIHMDIEDTLTLNDPQRAHVLLRCTQEIITNAVRHSGARNLWLECRREDGHIVVRARDDGRGAEQVTSGNGLRGLRERLNQYGGDMTIATRAGGGFRLTLRIPAEDALQPVADTHAEPISGGVE